MKYKSPLISHNLFFLKKNSHPNHHPIIQKYNIQPQLILKLKVYIPTAIFDKKEHEKDNHHHITKILSN
ncbi:hypothetical protein AW729_00250 [Methanosphaera sp. BMS]|nr:hypothetical protein AW729_00250 [Methanosphaera sp. BMS]